MTKISISILKKDGIITYFTTGELDDDQISFSSGDLTELVAVLLAGDPGGLLTIVRLGLIRTFHLQRDEQVLSGIRIRTHILLRGHDELDEFLELREQKFERRRCCEGSGGTFAGDDETHVRRDNTRRRDYVSRTTLELPCKLKQGSTLVFLFLFSRCL